MDDDTILDWKVPLRGQFLMPSPNFALKIPQSAGFVGGLKKSFTKMAKNAIFSPFLTTSGAEVARVASNRDIKNIYFLFLGIVLVCSTRASKKAWSSLCAGVARKPFLRPKFLLGGVLSLFLPQKYPYFSSQHGS